MPLELVYYTIVEIIGILGLTYIIVMGLAWFAERRNDESQCTHDCDQGRHCSCGRDTGWEK